MSIKDDVYKKTLLQYSKNKEWYLPFEDDCTAAGTAASTAAGTAASTAASTAAGTASAKEKTIDAAGEASNPSCGDEVRLSFRMVRKTGPEDPASETPTPAEEGTHTTGPVILQARHDSMGCAVCLASVNMLCELSQGKSPDEIIFLAEKVETVLDPKNRDTQVLSNLSKEEQILGSLIGIKKYPVRITCARLAWDLAKKLLDPHRQLPEK